MSIDNKSTLEHGIETSVVVGTRFWANSERPEKDLARLALFLESAEGAADETLVAVNVVQDCGYTINFVADMGYKSVKCIPVEPWGFASALNALIGQGIKSGHDQILFASAEFPPNLEYIHNLQKFMTENTITVGAVLEHEYHPGHAIHCARASQMPWNTFCLTDLKKSLIGVPVIADVPDNQAFAGMEEAVTLALNHELFGYSASLVEVRDLEAWSGASGWSEERKRAHEKKLASKDLRAEYQLKRLGLEPPTVIHEKP